MTWPFTIRDLVRAIEALKSDRPDPRPEVWYTTQKEHWLGWLRDYHGPGAYGRVPRRPRRDARFAYNHIVEPKMLSWLIEAAGVDPVKVGAARRAARPAGSLNQKSAAIRKHVPWETVLGALLLTPRLARNKTTYEFFCRHPHGLSAVNGYRGAARHFGLCTMEDPGTVGADTTRLLIHRDARKLREAARVLSRAYASDDDDAIEQAENWLALKSGVHWFDHDWRFWDIEQDEGALDCLDWERTIAESEGTYRVTLRLAGPRKSR